MPIVTSSFECRITNSFLHIMFGEYDKNKRNKRFRIFLFAYMFGAVTAEAIPIIFFEDNELTNKNYSETRNYSLSLLKYFAGNSFLKRITTDSYTLSSGGAAALFDFLSDKHLLLEEDKLSFEHHQRICSVHTNHASNNGITIIQLIRCYRLSFCVEPIISEDGKFLPAITSTFSSKSFSPDAYFHSDQLNEDFFIETDNCEERMNNQLVPKLRRYLNFIFDSSKTCTLDATILFSISYKHAMQDSFGISTENLNDQISFIDYFNQNFSEKISCQEMVQSILSYSGKSLYLSNLKDSLHFIELDTGLTYSSIVKNIIFSHNMNSFSKKFLNRRDTIYKSISRIEGFKNALLQGARVICLPIFNQFYLYKFVLIENEFFNKYFVSFIAKKHCIKTPLKYHKSMHFFDIKYGFDYVFRNVFEYRFADELVYYIFENITEDLGGYFRIKNYLEKLYIVLPFELNFYCLYNEMILPNPDAHFKLHFKCSQGVSFISYSEFLKFAEFS